MIPVTTSQTHFDDLYDSNIRKRIQNVILSEANFSIKQDIYELLNIILIA